MTPPILSSSSRLHRRLLMVEASIAGAAARPMAGRDKHRGRASAARGTDLRSDRQPEPTDSNASLLSWRC